WTRARFGSDDSLCAQSLSAKCFGPVPAPGAGAATLGIGPAVTGRPPVRKCHRSAHRTNDSGDVDSWQLRVRRAIGSLFWLALRLRILFQRGHWRGTSARALSQK